MANTNAQAIVVTRDKLRPLADRLGQLYNLCKALQAEAVAENWTALFPADGQIISDGAESDGRSIVTNTDANNLNALVTSYVNFMEASSNANRNLVLKMAVNPERI